MVRKSLLVAALLAIATPAWAQEDMVWSSKRPDAQVPLGIQGARTLEQGEVEFTYRYDRLNLKGVWFEDYELPLDFIAGYYQVVPLSMVTETHSVGVAVAASSRLTLSADLGYSLREREQITSDYTGYYYTDAEKLGDLRLSGEYLVFDKGPYRANLSLGALVPTGSTDAAYPTIFSTPGEEPLPYEMRAGAGTFAVVPGLAVMAQNEMATVGAQVGGTVYVGTNDKDYAPGDIFQLNVWAAYKATEYIAVTARAAYRNWGTIDGADPALSTARDPGNDSLWLGGSRLDIPVGFSILMPEGSRFAGHRLTLEYVYPATHNYDGPQLAADWGLVAGWQVVF